MVKRLPYLWLIGFLVLICPISSWARHRPTPTETDIPEDTATATITDTPTITATVNVTLGRKLYTFDAMWTNKADPLNDPEAIAISPNTGHMIIADSGNNRIVIWDTDGTPLKSVGSFGPRADWRNPPQFNHPTAVFIHPSKKMYVSDTQNNRIVVLDETGMVLSTWGTQGSAPGQFNLPRTIAIDHFGNFWVLDSGNSRVQIFSALGQFNATWGSFGTGDYLFNNPLGMAINNIDQAIVADTGNFRAEVFNDGGAGVTQFGWYGNGPYQFKEPNGVAMTKESLVAVTDGQNGGVNFYNARNGQYEFVGMWRAKDDITTPNYNPEYMGVACDAEDRLYLTDIKNNAVIRLKPIKDNTVVLAPTPSPTPVVVNPYGGNGYPIR